MRKVLFLAAMFLVGIAGLAQAQTSKRAMERKDRKEAREEKRKQEKALEAIQDTIAYQNAIQALKDGSFVVEANNVIFKNGIMRFVSSNTNFISVNNGQGIVQTAFNNFIYSPNGIGGVTVKGSVADVRMNKDKDGNIFYSFSINGIAISATVDLVLTGGTNQVSATVNPNFSGNTLTFSGILVPYDQSTVFTGTSLF